MTGVGLAGDLDAAGKLKVNELMKNLWPWLIAVSTISTVILGFMLGLGFMRVQGLPMHWMSGGRDVWRNSFWHHHGMRWGVSMMGVFWGLLMLLILLGLLALVVVGIVLLVRALQQPNRDQSEAQVKYCNHCGKKIAPEWQVCPYCGESLKGD